MAAMALAEPGAWPTPGPSRKRTKARSAWPAPRGLPRLVLEPLDTRSTRSQAGQCPGHSAGGRRHRGGSNRQEGGVRQGLPERPSSARGDRPSPSPLYLLPVLL